MECNNPDVAAIQRQEPQGTVSVFSVYMVPIGGIGRVTEQGM